MRTLALALLLGACAAPAPKSAPKPAVEPNEGRYRIPSRIDLAGGSKEAPNLYDKTLFELDGRAMLRLLSADEVLRDDAVLILADHTDQTGRPKGAAYSWKPVDDALDALDILFALPPGAWRRWAVFDLFSVACSETRGRISLDPADLGTDARWARCGALRARGLADGDAFLAEVFERYAEDPLAPKWREARAAADAARARMEAARPETKEVLAEAWTYAGRVSDAQLAVGRRLAKAAREKKGVPAKRREALAALENSWVEHRLRAVWGTTVPHVAADCGDEKEAASYGFVIAPVRLGWPDIPPR